MYFWVTVCKTVRYMLSDRCLSCLSCLTCLSVPLVYCGQTVRWIRMPLCTEAGLGPSTLCYMGTQFLPKGAEPPIFGPCLLWRNGWMNQVPLGTEIGLGPGDIVRWYHGDPAPSKKGAQQHPTFRPMTIVSKRLDGTRCHLVQR